MPKIVVQYEIWRLIFHLAWPWLWRGRKVAQKVKNICVQVFGGLYWLNSKVVFNCCPVWTWHCKWRWIDLQSLILPRALMQSLCCEIFWWWWRWWLKGSKNWFETIIKLLFSYSEKLLNNFASWETFFLAFNKIFLSITLNKLLSLDFYYLTHGDAPSLYLSSLDPWSSDKLFFWTMVKSLGLLS